MPSARGQLVCLLHGRRVNCGGGSAGGGGTCEANAEAVSYSVKNVPGECLIRVQARQVFHSLRWSGVVIVRRAWDSGGGEGFMHAASARRWAV